MEDVNVIQASPGTKQLLLVGSIAQELTIQMALLLVLPYVLAIQATSGFNPA